MNPIQPHLQIGANRVGPVGPISGPTSDQKVGPDRGIDDQVATNVINSPKIPVQEEKKKNTISKNESKGISLVWNPTSKLSEKINNSGASRALSNMFKSNKEKRSELLEKEHKAKTLEDIRDGHDKALSSVKNDRLVGNMLNVFNENLQTNQGFEHFYQYDDEPVDPNVQENSSPSLPPKMPPLPDIPTSGVDPKPESDR